MFRKPVHLAAASLFFVVMILCGFYLCQAWTGLIRDAQSRNTTLAFLLAEQTTRTFQAVDLTLAGLEPVFAGAPLPPHSPAFEKLLTQRVAELDFIHALYVVNPAGEVTQTSAPTKNRTWDVSTRRYFQAFDRDPKLKFLIGQPLFNQPGMASAIPVVRRLTTADGGFGGIIVASVQPTYFSDFYRNLDFSRRGSIDLYQDNGSILLASTNGGAASPVPLIDMTAPVFDTDSNLGLFRSNSLSAGPRIVAYHRAQGYPLVVAVGIEYKDIQARWWHVAAPTLAGVAVVGTLGLALAILIERRLDERRRAQSRAVTMQKLEALGQMTASVSHDFRNLLTVMSSTIRLLRKHGPSEKILSAAEEAIARGNGLVTQLLAFSRRQELRVQPADINLLLRGLEQVLRHAAGTEVTIRLDTAESLPPCLTDPTQFDAALMNLVVNARQAMPNGGEISIATRMAGGSPGRTPEFVELRVSDRGEGIAPADLKRIFEPFFTTKAETGTGLGLSQVYGFMRQIGGDVTVSSALGVGTTFGLLFPTAGSDGPHVVAAPQSRLPTALSGLSTMEQDRLR